MKRKLMLLLTIILVLTVTGCGGNKEATVKNEKNNTTQQKETDISDKEKANVSDKEADNSVNDNPDEVKNNSLKEQSSANATTDENQTATSDSFNKNNNKSNSNGTTTKPNTNTQTNTHKHSYSAATCTKPQTCSCGATKGNPLGHTYVNATCTKPKTCSCGATNGTALGHNYDEDGVCTRCKIKDPNFTYPSVSTMKGAWITVVYTDDESAFSRHRLACYFDVFGKGTFDIADKYCVLEEELAEKFPDMDIDETDSMVWDNKSYYCFGGGFLCPENTVYSETDDVVKIVDGNNKTIVLQRVATNTMKVKSVDSGFADDKLKVNTILKFYKD